MIYRRRRSDSLAGRTKMLNLMTPLTEFRQQWQILINQRNNPAPCPPKVEHLTQKWWNASNLCTWWFNDMGVFQVTVLRESGNKLLKKLFADDSKLNVNQHHSSTIGHSNKTRLSVTSAKTMYGTSPASPSSKQNKKTVGRDAPCARYSCKMPMLLITYDRFLWPGWFSVSRFP